MASERLGSIRRVKVNRSAGEDNTMTQLSHRNSSPFGLINRRQFLAGAAATAAFTIVPRHVLGGAKYVAPSEKIRLAIIGCGAYMVPHTRWTGLIDDVRIYNRAVKP